MTDMLNDLGYVPLLLLLGAVGLPAMLYAGLGLGESILKLLPAPFRRSARPWVWLSLPILLIVTILAYPVVVTIITSLQDARGEEWVGFDNYQWAFSGRMLGIIGNNVLWLIAFPLAVLVLALLAAVLFDKVNYEPLAITIVVLPTAISFTAGAVIWS